MGPHADRKKADCAEPNQPMQIVSLAHAPLVIKAYVIENALTYLLPDPRSIFLQEDHAIRPRHLLTIDFNGTRVKHKNFLVVGL
jgi:hypothetical protein